MALETWEAAGVRPAVIRDPSSYTGAAFIFVDAASGDNAIIISPGAAARIGAGGPRGAGGADRAARRCS